MKNFSKSSILFLLLVTATIRSNHESKNQYFWLTNAPTIITVATMLGTVAAVYKGITLLHRHHLDSIPLTTFMNTYNSITNKATSYLHDYTIIHEEVVDINTLITSYYPHEIYPTLVYYENLRTLITDLESFKAALKRRKLTITDESTLLEIEEYIVNLENNIEQLRNFKNILEKSKNYCSEYKARSCFQSNFVYKHYPAPSPETKLFIIKINPFRHLLNRFKL